MSLSPLENEVMSIIWQDGPSTATQLRNRLQRPLKESTVRTLLRRMEEKGFVSHSVEGRTYVYRAVIPRRSAAAAAVERVVDRFCEGSVEILLLGMVENEMIDPAELLELAERLQQDEEGESEK